MRQLLATFAVAAIAANTVGFAAEEEITPPQVYQLVEQVGADIELIRETMGGPRLAAPPWVVEYAEPRHVFYQAQVLFRKANRLAVQLDGNERVSPAVPEGEIRPEHVFGVIQGVKAQLDLVREEIDLPYSAELPELDADRQPRDVLREVVQAGRQLNLLLNRPIRPEDVYGRLELAAAYVAGVLTEDESMPVYGTLPPFDAGKVPSDVYRRVLECLALTQVIGERQGIDVLRLNVRRELRRRDIAPADVYHLATTLLAELAHLTLELEGKDVELPPLERPKHIFPSHVYRLAGMLQDELATLEARL